MVKHKGLDGLEETELELVFQRDGTGFKGSVVVSDPPPGCHKVINLYINEVGKLVINWSDEVE